MRLIKIMIVAIFSISSLGAQNIGDAVRYSGFIPQGTAGAIGIGNSLGAIGGDFSVIGINPAGIAEYRKSVFTFSPSINASSVDGYFVEDKKVKNRSRSSFLVDNISFVNANRRKNNQTSNWAIGFSKLIDFSRDVKVEGSTTGSITEQFVEQAGTSELDDLDAFGAGVIYDAQAIFKKEDGTYGSDYLSTDVVAKDVFIDQRGAINELSFGWAGSFNSKLNMGISIGVPFITYSEKKTYKESLTNEEISTKLTFVENLSTSGTGINLKLGMQYKILPQFRIGGAIHSPTAYALSDDYSSLAQYEYTTTTESGGKSSTSPDGSFKYAFTSPWKVVGSAATVYNLGKIKGFANIDVEYLDYKNNEFDFTSRSSSPTEATRTQEVNGEIDDQLGAATNIRLGTELAYGDVRLRGGYAISQSPFNSQKESANTWSLGIGFRGENFFVDLGYRRKNAQEGYNAYVVDSVEDRDPLANLDTTYGKIVATVGFKF